MKLYEVRQGDFLLSKEREDAITPAYQSLQTNYALAWVVPDDHSLLP